MPAKNFTIETLMGEMGFVPTENQREAILHLGGHLYLSAGPGSGKTRVLLWRTLNLIVFHGVSRKGNLREFEAWDPVVGIEVDPDHVQKVIRDFGRVVGCIEDGEFGPAPLEVLNAPFEKKNPAFGAAVCRKGDARFSCDSYRAYAHAAGSRAWKEAAFKHYLEDYGTDLDQQDWLSSEPEASNAYNGGE
jgi:hypothetical protein